MPATNEHDYMRRAPEWGASTEQPFQVHAAHGIASIIASSHDRLRYDVTVVDPETTDSRIGRIPREEMIRIVGGFMNGYAVASEDRIIIEPREEDVHEATRFLPTLKLQGMMIADIKSFNFSDRMFRRSLQQTLSWLNSNPEPIQDFLERQGIHIRIGTLTTHLDVFAVAHDGQCTHLRYSGSDTGLYESGIQTHVLSERAPHGLSRDGLYRKFRSALRAEQGFSMKTIGVDDAGKPYEITDKQPDPQHTVEVIDAITVRMILPPIHMRASVQTEGERFRFNEKGSMSKLIEGASPFIIPADNNGKSGLIVYTGVTGKNFWNQT